MGVSSVFTLLLCGKTTFPWAVAFVSATMGLTTFSHRYRHRECLHTPVSRLEIFSRYKGGQFVSVFYIAVLFYALPLGDTITYVSIAMRTAPHNSLSDIKVPPLLSVKKSIFCPKLYCWAHQAPQSLTREDLAASLLILGLQLKRLICCLTHTEPLDSLNFFVFCSLALTTYGKSRSF